MPTKTYQGSISLAKVKDGEGGTPGTNTATVYLYQRAATIPQKPNQPLTYTFSTGVVSGSALGNWKQNIAELTGTNPIYFILAVASSTDTTDTIESGDWKGPSILAQDGQNGQNGRGVDSVEMRFINWATNTEEPTTSTSGWTTNVPTYDSSKPYYYVWVQTSYNDNSIPTNEIYLDNGLSDANRTAAVANSIAQSAEESAQGALAISQETRQYFWLQGQQHSTAVPAGAYVTPVSADEFKSNPGTTPNLLLQSDELALRRGAEVNAKLDADGLVLRHGGIRSGNSRTDDFVYLSSNNFADSGEGIYKHTTDIDIIQGKTYYTYDDEHDIYNVVINPVVEDIETYYEVIATGTIVLDNYVNDDWREIIGTKFGVRADGTLYAANANINGHIVAQSLTINGDGNTFNGVAAMNITGYQIVIERDFANPQITDPNKNVYLIPKMYHNGVLVTDVVNTHFLWYKDDIEDHYGSEADGGILALYGHNYRVDYEFDDGQVGGGEIVQERTVETKYITQISEDGITIHPVPENNTTIARLDSTGLDIKKNGISIAKYGDISRIGVVDGSRFVINSDSLQAFDNHNNQYFEVSAERLSWGDGITPASSEDIDNAISKYITDITGSGIYIHASDTPSDPSAITAKGVKITNQIDIIRDGSSVISVGGINPDTFNEIIQIGRTGETRIELDFHSMRMIDKEDNEYFHVSDLRNKDGGIIETTIAEPYMYTIGTIYPISDIIYLKVDNISLIKNVDYTFGGRLISFKESPSAGALIECNYIVDNPQEAKGYTIGIRKDGYIGGSSIVTGYNNIASGFYSHAEGFETIAGGYCSHAEGGYTQAGDEDGATMSTGNNTGRYAHVQNEGTVTCTNAGTALGRYNYDIDSDTRISEHALYLGNGDSNENRSNALAVTWEGDVKLAGDIYINCNSDSTGGTNITSPEEIPLIFNQCSNGSYTRCYKMGKIVFFSFNINITTVTTSYDYISGLPIPLGGGWGVSSAQSGVANPEARWWISTIGTLRADGNVTAGWHNGSVVYLCE